MTTTTVTKKPGRPAKDSKKGVNDTVKPKAARVLGKIPTPPTPPKKSGKKEKQVSFVDQSPTPATPQESARKTIEKLLESAFEEAFPNKAIIQYLGQKTIEGSDPFAAAVELASELQAVGNAVGKTLDDDRVARNING